jgi:L-alanine-DL-glutamate epimerase-like enolase superfamily enzyme
LNIVIISGIETVALRIPFNPGSRSAASAWGPKGLHAVDSLLVKVTTDQGIDGWGESFGFSGVPVTKLAIDAVITPLCIGHDASQIAALMRELQDNLAVFGRGGPFTHGLSAIDIALWDIAGKAAGAPLHRLLGGGCADLACYASLDAYSDPDLVRRAVRKALDAGFSAVKLHERDLAVVRAGRQEAGPDARLMIDVNAAWTVRQAQTMAEALREVGPTWLEEPVWPPENYDGLRQVRHAGGIAVAAGENVPTLWDFVRLFDAGAVDFVQPSPAKMGGVTELNKVFTAAAVSNVTVMPHSFYDGPGLLAAIHATAALGTADSMIEWRYFDLEATVYGDALTLKSGRISVPQGPGLGMDPNPDVICTYLLKS